MPPGPDGRPGGGHRHQQQRPEPAGGPSGEGAADGGGEGGAQRAGQSQRAAFLVGEQDLPDRPGVPGGGVDLGQARRCGGGAGADGLGLLQQGPAVRAELGVRQVAADAAGGYEQVEGGVEDANGGVGHGGLLRFGRARRLGTDGEPSVCTRRFCRRSFTASSLERR